jgi:hypothetical protein
MMAVLGNNRCARIILEDDLSEPFGLGRGRAQGDSPSPRQYNIGEAILLLKIEFDPEILKIGWSNPVPRPVKKCYENARISNNLIDAGTEKVDAFADDANVLTLCDYGSLARLKTVLSEFEKISGLECNVEKTSILYIGPENLPEMLKIQELGFAVSNKLTCLGFEIDNVDLNMTNNFDIVIRRMSQQAALWSRFHLSLHGRISVSKTFLISQCNYFGEILTPTDEQLDIMQTIVNNFVLRGVPWSKKKTLQHSRSRGFGFNTD